MVLGVVEECPRKWCVFSVLFVVLSCPNWLEVRVVLFVRETAGQPVSQRGRTKRFRPWETMMSHEGLVPSSGVVARLGRRPRLGTPHGTGKSLYRTTPHPTAPLDSWIRSGTVAFDPIGDDPLSFRETGAKEREGERGLVPLGWVDGRRPVPD